MCRKQPVQPLILTQKLRPIKSIDTTLDYVHETLNEAHLYVGLHILSNNQPIGLVTWDGL